MDALALACGNTPWGTLADAVPVSAVPLRDEVDPVLDRLGGRRLVVCGTDAALNAVVQRLLRTDRLTDVPVGFVPSDPKSEAAEVWGLPTDPQAALSLAMRGEPERAALIRDDQGGVLVGLGSIRPLRGVVYCDDELVLRGQASRLEVRPDPQASGDTRRDGLLVQVVRTGLLGRRTMDAHGRAVQIGCLPTVVSNDGRNHERATDKWTWYRHTEDWRLVRGLY